MSQEDLTALKPIDLMNRFAGSRYAAASQSTTLTGKMRVHEEADAYEAELLRRLEEASRMSKDLRVAEIVFDKLASDRNAHFDIVHTLILVREALAPSQAGETPKDDGWIKCAERMPHDRGVYWCHFSDATPAQPMFFSAKKQEWQSLGDCEPHYAVTHWRRLPDPPDLPAPPGGEKGQSE